MLDAVGMDSLTKFLSFASGGLTMALLLGVSRGLWAMLLDKERDARLDSLEKDVEIMRASIEFARALLDDESHRK